MVTRGLSVDRSVFQLDRLICTEKGLANKDNKKTGHPIGIRCDALLYLFIYLGECVKMSPPPPFNRLQDN